MHNVREYRTLKQDAWWRLPGMLLFVSTGQYKTQTADCRLQTADRVQNAD